MARSRMIKPEFFDDEKLASVSRDCRLFFVGLWKCSDDYGRVKGNPVWLKSNIFPYDEDLTRCDIEEWIVGLQKIGSIITYKHHGETFLYIVNFKKHQKVDKPSKASNPAPPENILKRLAKDSRKTRESFPRARKFPPTKQKRKQKQKRKRKQKQLLQERYVAAGTVCRKSQP